VTAYTVWFTSTVCYWAIDRWASRR
jgi:hypothetical protein